MSNHCLDVICIDCGREWCERCYNKCEATPNPEALTRFWSYRQEWADKYRNGDVMKTVTLCSDTRCTCGSERVYYV